MEHFLMGSKPTYDQLEKKIEALENALRKEEAFAQNALNSQVDTFYIFDPKEGKPLRWNTAFNKVSGYSNDEIRSMTPNDFYKAEDLEKIKKASQEVLNTGQFIVELSRPFLQLIGSLPL